MAMIMTKGALYEFYPLQKYNSIYSISLNNNFTSLIAQSFFILSSIIIDELKWKAIIYGSGC